jgi:hypothetical protein
MVICQICGKKTVMIGWNHLRIHNITLNEYKKRFPNVKTCSDEWIRNCSEAGKKGIKVTLKRTKERREKDPIFEEQYIRQRSDAGKIGILKAQGKIQNMREEDLKFIKKMREVSKRNIFKCLNQKRKNKPYWFMGVAFDSKQEMECAKVLNKYVGWIPKEGVNCHIQMKGGEVDFKINNIFIEYHSPYKRYYDERRALLDKNNYKKEPVFVFGKVKELEFFCKLNFFKKF